MRITMMISLLLCCATTPCLSDEVVHLLDWNQLKDEGRLNPDFPIMTDDGISIVVISNEKSEATNLRVIAITYPAISEKTWAIRGNISYEDVGGNSFIEMWSNLGAIGEYRTRALEEKGPMGVITGSSDWRPFILPFFSNERAPQPESLVVNIQFTGAGTVFLGPLEIVEYKQGEDPLGSVSNAWWSNRQAGIFGGILGGLIGMCGTLVGILAAIGRSRPFVTYLLRAMTIGGMLAVILAILALTKEQPYAVWYPPALLGCIAAIIGIVLLPVLSKVYDQREKRQEEGGDA